MIPLKPPRDSSFTNLSSSTAPHSLVWLLICLMVQVGGNGLRALTAARQPLSMEQILDSLLLRARLEAEVNGFSQTCFGCIRNGTSWIPAVTCLPGS